MRLAAYVACLMALMVGSAVEGKTEKRPAATIVVTGSVESTGQRQLIVRDDEYGRVKVFFSMTATVTGAVVTGATVTVEGSVIDDFIKSAAIEVMATKVTVEQTR